MKSIQNWPAPPRQRRVGIGVRRGEVDQRLDEAERRELALHDRSAAKTTRCPRSSSTLPSPMHWLVGPWADSGRNSTVRLSVTLSHAVSLVSGVRGWPVATRAYSRISSAAASLSMLGCPAMIR